MPRRRTGADENIVSAKALGKRIRSIRTEKHISVQKIADSVGVQRSFINQLEAGDKFPSFGTLIAIINALGVSADEILYDYITVHDTKVIESRVGRMLAGASEEQIRRIEAHIQLELSMGEE
ncbi:MAG: helix-turn-helix transcriptional regulator [Ruminococcaceae bacterium]|nr:helix-turn-helix transcriptional regulator [Oscillospiraceae bacterium]